MKKVIKSIISGLHKITKILEEAYSMTYESDDLIVQFKQEVIKRRKKNEQDFKDNLEAALIAKFVDENGFIPDLNFLTMSVNVAFEEAKRNGDVDLLYRLKEENEK